MNTVEAQKIELFDVYFHKLCCYRDSNDPDLFLDWEKDQLLKQWILDIQNGDIILTKQQLYKFLSINVDPGLTEWMNNYYQLTEYCENNKSLPILQSDNKIGRKLYIWMEEQRIRFKYGKLSEQQRQLIISLSVFLNKMYGYDIPAEYKDAENSKTLSYIDLASKNKRKNRNPMKNEKKIKTLKETIEETEKATIKEALVRTLNNKTNAAKMLGIDRKTLYNKLDAYKIKY